MIVKVQFITRPGLIDTYRAPLLAALDAEGIAADLATDHPAGRVDYIVYAPAVGSVDLSGYTRAKAALGLWAGVETIIGNPTLTMPYARMVDEGLTQGMVDWVAGHVLRHHLGLDADISRDAPVWAPRVPPLATDRQVGVLGLGALGTACAEALAGLGFRVSGWSRRMKALERVACYAGAAGLAEVLARSEIVVLLLPATAETEAVLNAETLAMLPRGAVVLNPGRGALIDDAALLAALDSGQIAHATLDAFRVEPLPAEDPYWTHPQVTVTPHLASVTRPETAAKVLAENIRRGEAGEAFLHLVDRDAGY